MEMTDLVNPGELMSRRKDDASNHSCFDSPAWTETNYRNLSDFGDEKFPQLIDLPTHSRSIEYAKF